MDISLKSIKEWLKKNYPALAALGSILIILNYTGFNLNIPEFYGSLDTAGQILFIFIVNFLFTLVLFLFILGKIQEIKKN